MFQSPRFRFSILLTYWVIGFVVTHVPLPATGEVAIPNLDKLAHFCLYAGLSFFVCFWLSSHHRMPAALYRTILLCLLYAIADEGLQMLVPSRHASLMDWLADALGSLFGAFLFRAISIFAGPKTAPEQRDTPPH